jgi:PAS domain S-box-containing protein
MINKKRLNEPETQFNDYLTEKNHRGEGGEELLYSREIFSDIIKFLPDATFVINSAGYVIAWNQAMGELTDVKAEYMLGKGNYEYSIPFYGERRPILIDQVFILDSQIAGKYNLFHRKDGAITAEVFISKLKGKPTYLWGKAAPLYNSQGEIIGAIESIRDITDKKQAEEEIKRYQNHLEELVEKRTYQLEKTNERLKIEIKQKEQVQKKLKHSREKYRSIFQHAGIGIFQSTPQGRFFNVNQTFAQMFGYQSPEEMINDIQHIGHQIYTEPGRRREILEILQNAQGVVKVENDFVKKNGEKWVANLNLRVVRDDKGDPLYFEGFVEDITQRRNMEVALRKSESKYRTIFENTGTATVLIQEDTSLSLVNTEFVRLTGFSQEEVEGKSWIEFVAEDFRERMMKYHLLRTMDKSAPKNYEFRFIRKDGTIGDAYLTIESIPGTSQRIASIIDITDRKKSEKELRNLNQKLKESNVALEQFASVASHDLQEPLRMIISFLGLLERRYGDKLDPEAHEFIEFASDGAIRMKKMIRDLLTYSRLTTREKDLAEVDCQRILDQVLMNLKVGIEESKVTITNDPLPVLIADYSQLSHLFQNLISNAIKYRGQDNLKIHISAQKEDNEWLFTVEDNGMGIDPKYTERIFTIFQRLHGMECPGTGMGLAICKKVVERHDGHIWVDSEVGKGSKFHFTIPDVISP